jgi:hypothetical protein
MQTKGRLVLCTVYVTKNSTHYSTLVMVHGSVIVRSFSSCFGTPSSLTNVSANSEIARKSPTEVPPAALGDLPTLHHRQRHRQGAARSS